VPLAEKRETGLRPDGDVGNMVPSEDIGAGDGGKIWPETDIRAFRARRKARVPGRGQFSDDVSGSDLDEETATLVLYLQPREGWQRPADVVSPDFVEDFSQRNQVR